MGNPIAHLQKSDQDVAVTEVHDVRLTDPTSLIITRLSQNGSAVIDAGKNRVL
jgi:hypothetical protein